MPTSPKYKLVSGDVRAINTEFQKSAEWKPVLLTSVPQPSILGGMIIAVIMESIEEEKG